MFDFFTPKRDVAQDVFSRRIAPVEDAIKTLRGEQVALNQSVQQATRILETEMSKRLDILKGEIYNEQTTSFAKARQDAEKREADIRSELQKTHAAIQQENAKFKTAIEKLAGALQGLENKIEGREADIRSELQKNHAAIQQENAKFKIAIEKLAGALQGLENKTEQARAAIQDENKNLEDRLCETIKFADEKVTGLIAENAAATHQCQSISTDIARDAAEVKSLAEEMQKVRDAIVARDASEQSFFSRLGWLIFGRKSS